MISKISCPWLVVWSSSIAGFRSFTCCYIYFFPQKNMCSVIDRFYCFYVRVAQPVRFASTANVGFGSPDNLFEKERLVKTPGDDSSRDTTYFLLGGGRIIYASAARLALIKVRVGFCLFFRTRSDLSD
jgi:hypothetical protein